ncbi:MAG: hypothetical protein H6819_10620 [Phycisphaerales bacterium]|nr:hypothetical protein [Phycisphaerales bacterium]MCB9854400.1 hypothetical protein [Phycisphaerales bacterium]MCB9863601.1 hypothetical protein [Phycisphaerales bacterium]
MTAEKQHESPEIPKAISGDHQDAPPTEYMSGQISVMRIENPEIWERIDALSDGHFDVDAYGHLLSSHKRACDACGYNLYGNISGLCPECGTPIHGSADTRRLLSIRILDAMRTAMPEKWEAVAERIEKRRMESVEREFSAEGARRDEIRRKAMQSWLDRKRGESKK